MVTSTEINHDNYLIQGRGVPEEVGGTRGRPVGGGQDEINTVCSGG